jgi:hypothetical protein
MTSARPMAISRSRVQIRISFLREWVVNGTGAGVSGTDGARGWFWSVLCIFVLPSIYSTWMLAALDWICAADDALLSRARADFSGPFSEIQAWCTGVACGIARVLGARLAGREREIQRGEGGNDGCFRSKDELTEGRFAKTGRAGRG